MSKQFKPFVGALPEKKRGSKKHPDPTEFPRQNPGQWCCVNVYKIVGTAHCAAVRCRKIAGIECQVRQGDSEQFQLWMRYTPPQTPAPEVK